MSDGKTTEEIMAEGIIGDPRGYWVLLDGQRFVTYLPALLRTGLYGETLGEVAKTLVTEGILSAIRNNFIKIQIEQTGGAME